MADLIGGLVSAGINYGFSQDQFNKQRYLQHDSQRYNSLMFDTVNAYNSPLSQMMRFKQAGLNPNLIYGQMVNGSPAPSSGIGSASQAQSQPMSMLETAQIGLIDAQKENIEADTREKEQNIEESGSRIDKMNAEIDQIAHQNNWTDQQIAESKKLMDKYNKEIEELGERISIDKLEQDTIRLNNSFLEKSMDDRIALVQSEVRRNNAQANLSYQQAREISTLLTQKLENLKAEWNEINSRTDLNKAQRDKLMTDKMLEEADSYYLMIAQKWHEIGGPADVLAFIPELVHMFTHILRLSLK